MKSNPNSELGTSFLKLLCAVTLALPLAVSAAWQPAKGPLATKWAKDVKPSNVHPEYPRPQMVREQWQNLNGLWSYAITAKAAAQPAQWDGEILVPFPVESALSGVMKPLTEEQRLWYHRTFKVPAKWKGQRVLLHFGAVDWETIVAVNGKEVGTHRGGFDGFSFDITDALKASGEQEIVVSVWDPTDRGPQAKGKQVLKPGGIMYTATSGIWQTAWLEAVPAAHISRLRIVPDLDNQCVRVTAEVAGNVGGMVITVEVKEGRRNVAVRGGQPNQEIVVPVPDPKLWTPDTPFLYDLGVMLGKDQDRVAGYFGMRKVALGKDADGIQRLMLNNKPLFQYGPLDQGFWPDGIYTAPTDEALRYDIEITKALGCNMARKHVKIEPDRWYYWADKLGLLVWQDMPGSGVGDQKTDTVRPGREDAAQQFQTEMKAMIEGRWNHPCIVMWVPFNEGWGQHDTPRLCAWIKQLDPTRLVNNASGWTDRKVGDVIDMHNYPGPGAPKLEPNRAAVLGEFGGLGLPVKGHSWQDEKNWGYRSFTNSADLTEAYLRLMRRLHPLAGKPGLCAAVYTQTTDCEVEVNGLLTYDRAMVKMNQAAITKANRQLYLPPPPPPVLKPLSPTSKEAGVSWRYTTAESGTNWMQPNFSDSGWSQGPGGFGTQGTPGAVVRTTWNTSDIWLRRTFDAPGAPDDLRLVMHHDEDAEVYLNGVLAAKATGAIGDYEEVTIRRQALGVLKPTGNVLAVHCHQTGGGQYIDVGVYSLEAAGR